MSCFFGSAFRYAITKAFCVAFLMTFFSIFDVPVFWPILLCYWIVLFVLTMKRQIMHMMKYKYVPFSLGKQVRALESFLVTTPLLSLSPPSSIFSFCRGNWWLVFFSFLCLNTQMELKCNNSFPSVFFFFFFCRGMARRSLMQAAVAWWGTKL